MRRFSTDYSYNKLVKRYVRVNGWSVKYGPFTDMKYVDTARLSKLLPKIIGSYEMELHPIIYDLLKKRFDVVIDVGCAEGYYAVGFALKSNSDVILAFDTDNTARGLCHKMAILNDVENRVVIGGICTPEILNIFCSKNCLVICDCEGYEFELLDPSKVYHLKGAYILVEIHEWHNPEIPSAIHNRFKQTHDFIYVPMQVRKPDYFNQLNMLSKKEQLMALDEVRMFDCNYDRYEWIMLSPKC
jgi:hypothetical protein